MEPGSRESSALSLTVICLGAGIFAAFYIYYALGVLIGTLTLTGGIVVTAIVSWMIVRCAEHFDAKIYEEIAMKAYGPKTAKFTIVMELMCQLGFIIAYVVLLKTLLPVTIEQIIRRQLPTLINESSLGQTVWALVFCFCVILPMSIPRKLSSARYSNIVSFVLSMYFSLALVLICIFNKELVPDLQTNMWQAAFKPQMDILPGIVSCIPLMIFCVMYQ